MHRVINIWTARLATPSDASVIAHHRYFGADETSDDREAYAEWLNRSIQQGKYVGFIADVRSVAVAGAGAVLMEWGPTRGDPSPVRGRIVNVFTNPASRQRGIATHLIEQVMLECGTRGIRTFTLASTPQSSALYERLGFSPYPTEMIHRR